MMGSEQAYFATRALTVLKAKTPGCGALDRPTIFRRARRSGSALTIEGKPGNQDLGDDHDLEPKWRASGYSIRIPSPSTVPCWTCGKIFRAAGPTGFVCSQAICDGCMLMAEKGLGMVLMMIAVCRYYGALIPQSLAEEQQHREEMLAFARVYERFAERFGPSRPWGDFLSEKPPM